MLDLTAGLKPKTDAPAYIRDADDMNFEQSVLDASMTHPVIVDFWAPWCGPCKQMMPALEKVVTESQGAVHLVKVNVDKSPGIAQALRVQSVPTVYAFFQGRPVDGFAGAQPESTLRTFVEKLKALAGDAQPAGPDTAAIKKLIEEGDEFFRAGQNEDALARFSMALDADPDNMDALGAVGWCLQALGDAASAREMLGQIAPEHLKAPRLKGLSYVLALGEKAAAVEPRAALEQKLAVNKSDSQALFDMALHDMADGRLEAAIDGLVTIIRRDRDGMGKNAQAQLVDLFEALGPAHPATGPGRRKMSSVLFS